MPITLPVAGLFGRLKSCGLLLNVGFHLGRGEFEILSAHDVSVFEGSWKVPVLQIGPGRLQQRQTGEHYSFPRSDNGIR